MIYEKYGLFFIYWGFFLIIYVTMILLKAILIAQITLYTANIFFFCDRYLHRSYIHIYCFAISMYLIACFVTAFWYSIHEILFIVICVLVYVLLTTKTSWIWWNLHFIYIFRLKKMYQIQITYHEMLVIFFVDLTYSLGIQHILSHTFSIKISF